MTVLGSDRTAGPDPESGVILVALDYQGRDTTCRAIQSILGGSGAVDVRGDAMAGGAALVARFLSVTEAAMAALDVYEFCSFERAGRLRAALCGAPRECSAVTAAARAQSLLGRAEPDRILMTAEIALVAGPAFNPAFELLDMGVCPSLPGGAGERLYEARRADPIQAGRTPSNLEWARRVVHSDPLGPSAQRELAGVQDSWQTDTGFDARLTLICGADAAESSAFAAELALWANRDGATVLEGCCRLVDSAPFRSLREALGERPVSGGSGDTGLLERLESRLLSIIGEGPTVLVINDAQWMDSSTAMVLDYLLHHGCGRSFTVVLGTVGEVPETVESLVDQLNPGQLEQLRLGRTVTAR
ncbi:ATP-binding protein [Arthrobacter sp. H5]|uniref:ATP-binding protein n=1 Tax=Arthrobacter sp. H5 TaxID=1267973 RepID=UPI000484C531|nr:ATP-binding protein [Arthrobacter sp. H5]